MHTIRFIVVTVVVKASAVVFVLGVANEAQIAAPHFASALNKWHPHRHGTGEI